MKRYYLVMTVIWGVGMLVWSGALVKAALGGTANTFQVVFDLCLVMCFAVNLLAYLNLSKKKK